MRNFLENLREFKKIRKIKESEQLFLQIPLDQPVYIEKEQGKQEIQSEVIIIDLLEGECQTKR